MYDIVDTLENCLFLNDRLFSQGVRPDPDLMLNETVTQLEEKYAIIYIMKVFQNLASSRWMTKKELEQSLMEDLRESNYEEFISAIER